MVMKRKPIRLRQGYDGHVVLSQEDRLKLATFVLLLAQGKKQGELNKRQARTRRSPKGRSPPAQKRQCPPIQMKYEEGHACAESPWVLARRSQKMSAGFLSIKNTFVISSKLLQFELCI